MGENQAIDWAASGTARFQEDPPDLVILNRSPLVLRGLERTRDQFIDSLLEVLPGSPGLISGAWSTAVLENLVPPMTVQAIAEVEAIAEESGLDATSIPPEQIARTVEEHVGGIAEYGDLVEGTVFRLMSDPTSDPETVVEAAETLTSPDRLEVLVDRAVNQLRNGLIFLALSIASPAVTR